MITFLNLFAATPKMDYFIFIIYKNIKLITKINNIHFSNKKFTDVTRSEATKK